MSRNRLNSQFDIEDVRDAQKARKHVEPDPNGSRAARRAWARKYGRRTAETSPPPETPGAPCA